MVISVAFIKGLFLGSIMSTVQWMGDLRTIYMASWRDTEDGIKDGNATCWGWLSDSRAILCSVSCYSLPSLLVGQINVRKKIFDSIGKKPRNTQKD